MEILVSRAVINRVIILDHETLPPQRWQDNILQWFESQGRHDLPWQNPITPYRVWVSEIMLQQTQVKTVIPYFKRFIAAYPRVQDLAQAELDQVLHLWTGLGYYTRARNLHRSAQLICEHFAGELPDKLDDLIQLPGIGRSTAGAILAIAYAKSAPILDGNVKRVLSRVFAIAGWAGQTEVLKKLWAIAESYTPEQNTAAYTQAMMDIGATLCTRRRPSCLQCPLMHDCQAYKQQRITELPTPKPKKIRPLKTKFFLLLCNQEEQILLQKRPPTGIWGGLWSFPEMDSDADIEAFCLRNFALIIKQQQRLADRVHHFSHYSLKIQPIYCSVISAKQRLCTADNLHWFSQQQPAQIGLPKPIESLLQSSYSALAKPDLSLAAQTE